MGRVSHKPQRDAGFSVLEALIAMAILAAALLPLLALQGQFVDTVDSLERVESRMQAQGVVLSQISVLNLDKAKEGEMALLGATARWTAKPALDSRRTRLQTGAVGRYQITLYDVFVSIEYDTGRVETLDLKGLGWYPVESIFDLN